MSVSYQKSFIMSGVKLRDHKQQNDEAFKYYVNVYFHCENNSIVEANMIILAQHSPFCHRFFMSRKEMKDADMFFTTKKHSVVKAAIDIIYGKTVSVGDSDFKRVCSFLRMLQVEYEIEPTADETIQEADDDDDDDANRTFDKPFFEMPATSVSSSMQKKEVQHILSEQQAPIEEDPDNWTLTTESTQRVFSIDHSAERLETEKKIRYICKHCRETCFAFQRAESHYLKKHLAIKPLTEMLAKLDQRRKGLNQEYHVLIKSLKQNGSKTLVQHEMM